MFEAKLPYGAREPIESSMHTISKTFKLKWKCCQNLKRSVYNARAQRPSSYPHCQKNSDYLSFDKVIVSLKDSLNLYHLGSNSCTQVGTSFHNLSWLCQENIFIIFLQSSPLNFGNNFEESPTNKIGPGRENKCFKAFHFNLNTSPNFQGG